LQFAEENKLHLLQKILGFGRKLDDVWKKNYGKDKKIVFSFV